MKGWIVNMLHNQGKKNNSTIIVMKTRGDQKIGKDDEIVKDGDVVQIWSSKILDEDLQKAGYGINDYIEIECKGKQQGKVDTSISYWTFDIFTDDEIPPLDSNNAATYQPPAPTNSEGEVPGPERETASGDEMTDDDLPF